MTIFLIICAVILGAFISYEVLKPKLNATQKYDEETAQLNIELQQKATELQSTYNTLKEKKEEILVSIHEAQDHLSIIENQADQAAQALYDKSLAITHEKFAAAAEEERKKYLATISDYQKELALTMEEGTNEYLRNIKQQDLKYKELSEQFEQLKTTTNAAIEAAKRAEEIKQEANYYKLQLSELDLEEIRMLRNITPYLRDKEPLNKVIWKTYYEKPTTDLIGRVIGSGAHTGIYKITNLDNGMCYVGQAVSLSDRWKQHIKRGLGAETPTRNKLYPAMIAFGVENFSFEVIEECPREQLDDREDYWQEYFKAKEFGYSIK